MLAGELERVRRDGYAVDREEFDENFCCIAAPIFDALRPLRRGARPVDEPHVFDTEREPLAATVMDVPSRRAAGAATATGGRRRSEIASRCRKPAFLPPEPEPDLRCEWRHGPYGLVGLPRWRETLKRKEWRVSRASVTKAHNKIQELSWEPTYVSPVEKYATDYTFEKAPKKDPLKQVLRSYFPMEEEKDNRVFGAMDGAIRGNMFRQVQERWMEWQKLFLSIIPFPEISAARAMPLTIGTVPNPEVHNGLAIQMIDEVRHSTIQMNLKRLYMNHYIDPAGFDITEKAFQNCYAGTIGRQFGEGFITGDAITAANIYLTIVAETAFTNVLFVAMPGEAAANGDYLLPTVFHSVQSDESRHISNGYSIILMALADERNRELLERDLRYAWWNNHAVVDAAIGTFIEYGTKDRRKDRESYAEAWRRWIYDDYYRSYLVPLEKYGLRSRTTSSRSRGTGSGTRATSTRSRSSSPPAGRSNYWRIDGMDDTDFEWFEHKYPGWYDKYGKWWERYTELSKKNGHAPITFDADTDYVYPHRCWSCMVPCLIREDMVVDEVDGQVRTYCSETCALDRHGRVPPRVQGSPDAGDGQAHRQARVGDLLPRHGSRRDHQGPRLRP